MNLPTENNPTIVIKGDMRDVLAEYPDNCFDSVATDPPYEYGFMGKKWDGSGIAFDPETWAHCYRVLKPGGHLVAFGGPRTYHRIAVAIEDAGFEIRDSLMWLYGQGMPKSHDISKALDKAAGAEREVVGTKLGLPGYSLADNGRTNKVYGDLHNPQSETSITAPATPEAQQWDGWGTGLKPAFEPIVLARKPVAEKTIAANVVEHGTGAINIDASRIGTDENLNGRAGEYKQPSGRWPANVLLSHHEDCRPVGGAGHEYTTEQMPDDVVTVYACHEDCPVRILDAQCRFFYTAKASSKERNKGLPDGVHNSHPSVKPVAIMEYLVRLITPPNGIVLDPFAGSGTTLVATERNGFRAVAIDLDEEDEYIDIINHRVAAEKQRRLL